MLTAILTAIIVVFFVLFTAIVFLNENRIYYCNCVVIRFPLLTHRVNSIVVSFRKNSSFPGLVKK